MTWKTYICSDMRAFFRVVYSTASFQVDVILVINFASQIRHHSSVDICHMMSNGHKGYGLLVIICVYLSVACIYPDFLA